MQALSLWIQQRQDEIEEKRLDMDSLLRKPRCILRKYRLEL